MRTLIKHGLIVDPASHVHSKNNLLVEDGRIQGLTAEEPEADVILDAEGMVVSPGFVDIHMHEDPYDPEEGRLIPSIMTSYNNNYGLRRGSQPRLFPSQSRSC